MILNNHYTCILRLEELFLIHALFYISLNSVFKSSKFSSDVFKLFFFLYLHIKLLSTLCYKLSMLNMFTIKYILVSEQLNFSKPIVD